MLILNEREQKIINLIKAGATLASIKQTLGLTERTILFSLATIFKKMDT